MDSQNQTNYSALYTLITVFFFWGFIAAGNNIFIPFCKDYFHLDQFQSQLIDFAFYTAYYIGSLVLFAVGTSKGQDMVTHWGYKKSIVYGLVFSALGAVAMIIAVKLNVYLGMLIGFFIVALGFSLQQTAANPFTILLGSEETGASRVNLAGGINSLGTTLGPLIVAYVLFGSTESASKEQITHLSLDKVIYLYMGVGALFLSVAALFYYSKKLPEGKSLDPIEKSTSALKTLVVMTVLLCITLVPVFDSYRSPEAQKIEVLTKELQNIKQQNISSNQIKTLEFQIHQIKEPLEVNRMIWLSIALFVILFGLTFSYFASNRSNKKKWGAMKYPQLVLGMIAIFLYVGVEVGIGSNLGELLKQAEFGGFSNSELAPYISMYWGSMMIGRWAGAVNAFQFSNSKKNMLISVVPIVAFVVIILANILAGNDMSHLYLYVICVLLLIGILLWSKNKPSKTLLFTSIFGIIALLVGLNSSGMFAVYAFLSGGLACSVMWPAIFNLSLMGLGKYTAQGSSFLVMMILGGGIIPPIQGKLADIIGIHWSYSVSLFCFVYLAIFAWIVKNMLVKQGFSREQL